ncbi:hypothetical protein JHK87_040059 [Glycine soja]|nr:hypothetical protein JHK87_040059 [Glycine soja]
MEVWLGKWLRCFGEDEQRASSCSCSSHFSNPSSSHEFKNLKTKTSSSCALVKAKPSNTAKVDHTFTTMVKKFMDRKPKFSSSTVATTTRWLIPSNLLAKDLKKDVKKVVGFSVLQKKLIGKGASEKKEKVKALTEVKNNTRTLAMVLKSEKEFLNINKE